MFWAQACVVTEFVLGCRQAFGKENEYGVPALKNQVQEELSQVEIACYLQKRSNACHEWHFLS